MGKSGYVDHVRNSNLNKTYYDHTTFLH